MTRRGAVFSTAVFFATALSWLGAPRAMASGQPAGSDLASTEALILEKRRECEELEQRLAETCRRLDSVRDAIPWYSLGVEALASEDYRACVAETRDLERRIEQARWATGGDARHTGALVLYRRLVKKHGLPRRDQSRDGPEAPAVIARLDEALARPRYARIEALLAEKQRLAGAGPRDAEVARAARDALGVALDRLDVEIAANLDIMLRRFSETRRRPGGMLEVAYFSRYAESADALVVEARVDDEFKHRVSGGDLSPDRWAAVHQEYRLLRRRYPRSAHTRRAAKLYAAAIRRPPGPRAWIMGALSVLLPLLGLMMSLLFCRRNSERAIPEDMTNGLEP